MPTPELAILANAYQAFNARDFDAILAHMQPDIDWPKAFDGGRVQGKDAVREYWQRQFEQITPHLEPQEFTTGSDGRITITLRQIVHDKQGNLLADGMTQHVYTFRDGLIARMDIPGAGQELAEV
jgi:ketosteroid isomerase-like protein